MKVQPALPSLNSKAGNICQNTHHHYEYKNNDNNCVELVLMNLFFRQRSNIGTYFMLILEPCKEDARIGGSSMLLVPLVPNFGFGILRLETEDSRNWMDIKFEYTKREEQ